MKPAAMEGSNPAPVPLSMASSPLRLLREESMDANGTLSPISSRSNGTDTETETKKKVNWQFSYFIESVLRIWNKLNLVKIG